MIKKIRYKLVYNRAGCLNQRGEGLIQIEAEQQKRKIYFSTHTYVLPGQFAHGCIVNTKNADGLNYALFSMIRDIEDVELDYIKKVWKSLCRSSRRPSGLTSARQPS